MSLEEEGGGGGSQRGRRSRNEVDEQDRGR